MWIGILVGEIAVATLGGGYAPLAIATFVAMVIARALGSAPIIIAQAGIGAILTVTTADHDFSVNRLVDAAIGGGVALLFSQVLFSPEPVRLLRRSEVKALSAMAGGLETMALALERDDAELARRAMTKLRELRDGLGELSRLRRAGVRVARHSAIWRSQLAPVVRETEDAGHLDLLGGSCLMMCRVAAETDGHRRPGMARAAREFSRILTALTENLDDQETRQAAADRALEAVRRFASSDDVVEFPATDALTAVQMVATDIMTFAGVEQGDAMSAVRAGTDRFSVPAPAGTPRGPFHVSFRFPGLPRVPRPQLRFALSPVGVCWGWLWNKLSSRWTQ